MCAHLATKGVPRHVVDERLLPVDLDDGKQLSVPALELVVSRDVDLPQIELEVGAQLLERRASALAQMAAGRVVEDDVGNYG